MDATARERLQRSPCSSCSRCPGVSAGVDDRRVWWAVVAVSPVLAWTTSRELGLRGVRRGRGRLPRLHRAQLAVAAPASSRSSRPDVVPGRPRRRRGAAALLPRRARRPGPAALRDRRPGRARQRVRRPRGRARRRHPRRRPRHRPHRAARGARAGPGYRPVDLDARARGRRASLLRSAGIESAPTSPASPSRGPSRSPASSARRSPTCCATPAPPWVTMSYDDGVVAIRNDGVIAPVATGGPWAGRVGRAGRPAGGRDRDRPATESTSSSASCPGRPA